MAKLTINYLEEELTKQQLAIFFDLMLRNIEAMYSIDNELGEIVLSSNQKNINITLDLLKGFKKRLKEKQNGK